MIQSEISKFMALAPLIMPELIRNDRTTETDITEEYAILYFSFGERLPIGMVMDSCGEDMELIMLYHAASEQNKELQHCCFFPLPKVGGSMFKINIVTDNLGFADGVTVTIYDGTDIWEQALESDILAHSKGYVMTDAVKGNELLSLFMNLI